MSRRAPHVLDGQFASGYGFTSNNERSNRAVVLDTENLAGGKSRQHRLLPLRPGSAPFDDARLKRHGFMIAPGDATMFPGCAGSLAGRSHIITSLSQAVDPIDEYQRSAVPIVELRIRDVPERRLSNAAVMRALSPNVLVSCPRPRRSFC